MRPSAGKCVIKSADNGYDCLRVGVPLGGRGEFGECPAAFAATSPGGHAGGRRAGRACRRCTGGRPGTEFSPASALRQICGMR